MANNKPTWAKDILGVVVSVDATKRTVTLTFDADEIRYEGPAEDKKGNEKEVTNYFVKTLAKRGLEMPELAINGVIPVLSINGWFPNSKATKSAGKVLTTAIKAADRLAAARKR